MHMRIRPLLAGVAGLAAIVATAAPAAAIKYGQPDGGEHPQVGFMLAYVWDDVDGDGEQTDDELFAAWRCSGTLMDEDTFLTAGHCTSGADAAAIWFDDNLESLRQNPGSFVPFEAATSPDNPLRADAYSDVALTHPDYNDEAFYLHDVGVVDKLEWTNEQTVTTYGKLPELGYWDDQIAAKKKDRDRYESVGYGLQWSTPDRGSRPATPTVGVTRVVGSGSRPTASSSVTAPSAAARTTTRMWCSPTTRTPAEPAPATPAAPRSSTTAMSSLP